MEHIADLGYRIELVSMDSHCHDISIGLYEQQGSDGAPQYLVHTYSARPGARERIDFITGAMRVLGGVEPAGGAHTLRFPCGAAHRLACKRVFLEACKLPSNTTPEAKPLSIYDKKSERTITVAGAGGGAYRLSADGDDDGRARRVAAVAGGLMKLAEMQAHGAGDDGITFACGQPHDALIGLLLGRALNVRAAVREQEQAAARGVLAAPSAQQS